MESLSAEAAVHRLTTTFESRGWKRSSEAAADLVEAVVRAGKIPKGAVLARAVARGWLVRNGITRSQIAQVVEQALDGVHVVVPAVGRSQVQDGDHLRSNREPTKPKTVAAVRGNRQITILCLAAEPTDAGRLRLAAEVRKIREILQLSRSRSRFRLEQRFAVRPEDLTQALLDFEPRFVHFSGHGTHGGRICLENDRGETVAAIPESLSIIFKLIEGTTECVVLNACFSSDQANALVKHVPRVVGMSDSIGDDAAIAFSTGFYQAIGAYRSVDDAFEAGCAQIGLQGIDEGSTPILVRRDSGTS